MLEKKFGLNFCVSFCEKHMLNFFNSLHRTQVLSTFVAYFSTEENEFKNYIVHT
jgi:hypothetical protein